MQQDAEIYYDIIVFSDEFFSLYSSFCFHTQYFQNLLLSDRQEMVFKHALMYSLSGEHTVIPITIWWWQNLGGNRP
jgi:hypothetical protein